MNLTPDAEADYKNAGYYMAEGLLSSDECSQILTRGMQLIEPGSEAPNRVFMPHREDPCFMGCFKDPRIVETAEELAGGTLLGAQTMFYIKPAGSTGHGWHQDNLYLCSKPDPCIAAWCALEEITEENGALRVFRGSHQLGLLDMVPHNDSRFGNHEQTVQPPEGCEDTLVLMQPGDVLFFDGMLIHGSYPNTSSDSKRPAYIAHYVPESSTSNDENYERSQLR